MAVNCAYQAISKISILIQSCSKKESSNNWVIRLNKSQWPELSNHYSYQDQYTVREFKIRTTNFIDTRLNTRFTCIIPPHEVYHMMSAPFSATPQERTASRRRTLRRRQRVDPTLWQRQSWRSRKNRQIMWRMVKVLKLYYNYDFAKMRFKFEASSLILIEIVNPQVPIT